jgi:hypothetical protein
MKTLITVLTAALLTGIGCRSANRIQVLPTTPSQVTHQRPTDAERQAIRAELPPQTPTQPQPPITMEARYASICPYCDTVNLSDSTMKSGGYIVTNGQPLTVTIKLGVVTNIVSNVNGFLENWSMTYKCSNCREYYSDYRDQLVPKTRSIRLPLRTE